MSQVTGVHGGAAEAFLMRVFYRGTDTMREGYHLCWNFDALDVDAENQAFTAVDVGEENWNDARRLMVEKSQEGNKIHFAGVVSAKSDGVTGPGWIEIHRPGSICNVYTYDNVDHGESGITTGSGQNVTFVPGTYYFMRGGFFGCGTATVLQDVDRSSTPGLVMAELQVGEQSCGFSVINLLSTATTCAITASLSTPFAHCGVYAISYDSVDYFYPEQTGNATAAACSVVLGASKNPGQWIGQRCKIMSLDAYTTAGLSVALSAVVRSGSSLMRAVQSGNVELLAANEFVDCTWTGVKWEIMHGHEDDLFIS